MGFLIFLPLMLVICIAVVLLKAALLVAGVWMLVLAVAGTVVYQWFKRKGLFEMWQNTWLDVLVRVLRILSVLAIGSCWIFAAIVWGIWFLTTR